MIQNSQSVEKVKEKEQIRQLIASIVNDVFFNMQQFSPSKK